MNKKFLLPVFGLGILGSFCTSSREVPDSSLLNSVIVCEINTTTGQVSSYSLSPVKLLIAENVPELKTNEILFQFGSFNLSKAYFYQGKELLAADLKLSSKAASPARIEQLLDNRPALKTNGLFPSFDGQEIAFVKPEKKNYFAIVIDMKSKARRKFLLERPRVDSNEFVWSHDGKTLYYNSFDQSQRMLVRGLNLESGKTTVITDGGITAASFDGEEIYVYKGDSTARGVSLTLYSPSQKRVLKRDKSFKGGQQIIIGNSKGETLGSTFSSDYKNNQIVYRKIDLNAEDLVLRTYPLDSSYPMLQVFRK